jgi:phage terminase large subunit-like protein
MGKWRKCQVDEIPIDTRGMSVYAGFDMSAKIDLTSVAFVIPFLSGEYDQTGKEIVKYIVYSHSFIPNREKLAERKAKDKVDYDSWEREGFLSVTNTPIVDQNVIMQYVLDTCKKNDWKIECLCFDPANAGKLMMDLSNEGYDVEEVFQSHKSLNESTQGFREQVYSGNILYTRNPLLNFAMSNAVIRKNNGLIKIDKDASTKRIDPVDAVLCAYKLAMYHEFTSNYMDYIDEFIESEW